MSDMLRLEIQIYIAGAIMLSLCSVVMMLF